MFPQRRPRSNAGPFSTVRVPRTRRHPPPSSTGASVPVNPPTGRPQVHPLEQLLPDRALPTLHLHPPAPPPRPHPPCPRPFSRNLVFTCVPGRPPASLAQPAPVPVSPFLRPRLTASPSHVAPGTVPPPPSSLQNLHLFPPASRSSPVHSSTPLSRASPAPPPPAAPPSAFERRAPPLRSLGSPLPLRFAARTLLPGLPPAHSPRHPVPHRWLHVHVYGRFSLSLPRSPHRRSQHRALGQL